MQGTSTMMFIKEDNNIFIILLFNVNKRTIVILMFIKEDNNNMT